jgi:hypothetical protein
MKCKRCGEKLDDYCPNCQEVMFQEAITEVIKRRREKSRKGIIVFEDDPMYKAILERRDLDARTLGGNR